MAVTGFTPEALLTAVLYKRGVVHVDEVWRLMDRIARCTGLSGIDAYTRLSRHLTYLEVRGVITRVGDRYVFNNGIVPGVIKSMLEEVAVRASGSCGLDIDSAPHGSEETGERVVGRGRREEPPRPPF